MDYLNEKYLKLSIGLYISDNYIIKSYGRGLLILNKNDWKEDNLNTYDKIDDEGYYTIKDSKKRYKIISYTKERRETIRKLKRRRRKGIKINVSDIINDDKFNYVLKCKFVDFKYKWIDRETERAKIDIDDNGNITAYVSEYQKYKK